MTKSQLPTSLRVVAILFIVGGVLSAVDLIADLMNDALTINFGVLGVFAGLGILRLSRGWRTCGLVLLWTAIILIPVILLFAILGGGEFHYPPQFGSAGPPIAVVVVLILYAIIIWMYRVLTRPDIRELFGLPAEAPEQAD